jgi:hypothetical protein
MRKILNNYKKWNPSTLSVILLLMIPFIFFLYRGFVLDNDFWFLTNTGKEIIKNGFINIETFTIHSGLSFIPQQWLIDVLFALIYNNFGINGMFYLTLICNGIIIYLLYKTSYLISNNKKRSIIFTIIADILLICTHIITTRPQLFDVVTFTLELFLIESYIKKEKNIYLYFVPVLSLLLINYHASMWLMLFVLLVPYYIEFIILKIKKKDVYKIKPVIIVTIISLLCGFINPYGIEAIKYLYNSFGVTEINTLVMEMKAIDISNMTGKITFLIMFVLLYSFYHNKNNNKIRYFLLTIGIIYLALSHLKGVIFLGILFPIIMGYNFYKDTQDKDIKPKLIDKIVYIISIILLAILIIFKTPIRDGVKIKEFADYLDNNASYDIKLFTDYNTGAYMEYRGYKCYIDPRAEIFLKTNNHVEDIFNEFYNLEYGEIDPKEFLDKYQFDYLLVDKMSSTLLYELKNNKNYQEVLSKEVNDDIIHLYKRV